MLQRRDQRLDDHVLRVGAVPQDQVCDGLDLTTVRGQKILEDGGLARSQRLNHHLCPSLFKSSGIQPPFTGQTQEDASLG